jgi:hypothetical protein
MCAVEMPPGREDMLQKVKAKWFKREVDPELDVDLVVPPSKQAPSPRATPASAPPPARRPAARPAAAAAAAAAAPRPASLLEVALLLGHLFFVGATILAAQPLNRGLSYFAFAQACRASIAVHAARLFQKLGRPAFSPASALTGWFRAAATSSEAFYLLTSVIASNNPAMWLALLSPAILAAYLASATLQRALGGVPAWQRTGGAAHRWLARHREDALLVMALCEVGAGFQVALSAVRVGPRALLTAYMYFNQLRTRFWNPECRAHHVRGWALLGDKVAPLLRAAPPLQAAVALVARWFAAAGPQPVHQH